MEEDLVEDKLSQSLGAHKISHDMGDKRTASGKHDFPCVSVSAPEWASDGMSHSAANTRLHADAIFERVTAIRFLDVNDDVKCRESLVPGTDQSGSLTWESTTSFGSISSTPDTPASTDFVRDEKERLLQLFASCVSSHSVSCARLLSAAHFI